MPVHKIGAVGRVNGQEVEMRFSSRANLVECLVADEEGNVVGVQFLDEVLNQYADEINENTAAIADIIENGGGSGSGIPLGDCTGISITAQNKSLVIKWKDPEDAVVSGAVIAAWGKTILVRKQGSYPMNATDGTVILTSTVRNQYQSTGYTDTGLANGMTYYYKLIPVSKTGAVNLESANNISGTPVRIAIPAIPSQSGTLTYNGNTQSPMWSNYDSSQLTIGGVTTETNAGTYSATFTPKEDFAWSDGSIEAKSVTWSIGRAVIASVPSQNGSIIYDGSEKSPVWNNYDENKMTISGVLTATAAGNHAAIFTPKNNYKWSDGTTTAKTVSWTIESRTVIANMPSQSGTITYDGNSKSPSWNTYDANQLTLGGVTAGINAGSYDATFTPKAGYEWSDGTVTAKTVTWSIGRAVIANVPSQSGSITYDGNSKTPSWSNYDSGKMTLGGTTSGTNAGSYNAAFTPNSNYQWSDSTTTAKTVSWSISKAAGSLSISPTSITLNTSNLTNTISVTRTGDGTITATSSNTSVATTSVSGTTITVSHVNQTTGTATITVKVAAGTNHNAPSDKTCSVTAQFLPAKAALNDMSWAQIKEVSDAGQGANYWNVGDCKAVTLSSGTVGEGSIAGTYYCFILGFNHNSAKEGNNRIHFQFGKTALSDGKDIAFTDSVYNNTGSSAAFRMNTTNINSGGWNNSYMRKTIIPAFKNVLPADLKAVLKSVTKYSDNTGGGSDTASYVTATTDEIFLLAEYEVQGARKYANSAEQNNQIQYDYYKSGNSKAKYKHSSTGSIAYWWLRSVCATNNYFCCVGTGGLPGAANIHDAYTSRGFAPGFAV